MQENTGEVVAAGEPNAALTTIKVLKQTDTHAVIGGYGVVFGGRDLVGDTFTKSTDFMLDLVPSKPVLYDHGLGDVKGIIGAVSTAEVKADGLWIEAELERHQEYVEEVLTLVEKGALGWSSGSFPQLARRDETKTITQWPIVEMSLTPTPAEPRTINIERIKSLLPQEVIDAIVAEASTETDGTSVVAPQSTGEEENSQLEDIGEPNMSEKQEVAEVVETKATETKSADAAILKALEALTARIETVEKQPVNEIKSVATGAPVVLKHGRGDSETQALKAFLMGDAGKEFEVKASNATDMNIGTAADGGNTVPTGFHSEIIARRDETMLAASLPVRRIPGSGTTVDVPTDDEADGEFVTTAEAATFDLDAPAIGKKSLTLVKKTKYVDVSYELLDDTGVNLQAFLADFVGRGMAKTHNDMLVTEVETNGTSFKTFASATAIAFGEVEDIVGNDDLGEYLNEDAAVAWVTRNSTLWDIKSIVGSDRQYAVNVDRGRSILGYPVHTSQKVETVATGNKSILFGNWRYVGMREAPGITFIRDPYTVAVSGQVRLLWHFRTVYGVLQPEAIGYGEQA